MGRTKETVKEFCARIVAEYKGTFRTDNSILLCNFCGTALTGHKTSNVKTHIESKMHKKAVELANAKDKAEKTAKQTLITEHQKPQQINTFNLDICNTFLEANIPLKKISHPSVVNFVEKYTGKSMPSESSVRQKYVPILYNETMEKLRAKVGDRYIWTSIDETTDSECRLVTNFIFGILDDADDSPERGKCYLLNMAVVDSANASNMAAFYNDSLLLLWPNGKRNYTCTICIRFSIFFFFHFAQVFNTTKFCLH